MPKTFRSEEERREYLRRKKAESRAKARGEIPKELAERLPWPWNQGKPARWGPGVERYVAPTEEEREAVGEKEEMEREFARQEREAAGGA